MKILGIIALLVFVSLAYLIGSQFFSPGTSLVLPNNKALGEERIESKLTIYGLSMAPQEYVLQNDSMGVGRDANGVEVFQLVYKLTGKTDMITVLNYSMQELLWQHRQTKEEYFEGYTRIIKRGINIYVDTIEEVERPGGNQYIQSAKVLHGDNLALLKYYGEKKLSEKAFTEIAASLLPVSQLK